MPRQRIGLPSRNLLESHFYHPARQASWTNRLVLFPSPQIFFLGLIDFCFRLRPYRRGQKAQTKREKLQ